MKNKEKEIMKNKIVYAEPQDYFPEEIRKKYKLGEHSESVEEKAEGVVECCGGIQPIIHPPIFDEDKKEIK